jgi:hypothetical protein
MFLEEKEGLSEKASNDFLQHDLDTILERHSKKIKQRSNHAKGHTFSKASFTYLDKDSDYTESRTEGLDVDDPDFWTKLFGEDSLENSLFTNIQGSIDGLGKTRIRNKEINYDENFSGEDDESGNEKDNESCYSNISESDDDLLQEKSPQQINQSSQNPFYYSSLIPVIDGKLFLKLLPCFHVDTIAYGAKVASYRNRKDGLKGPAERLGLVFEIGDIMLEVNNCRIDRSSFEDIMKKLLLEVTNRTEVNICFFTPTGRAESLHLGAKNNQNRINPYHGPRIFSNVYVSPENMFPAFLAVEFQSSNIIIHGLKEVKKRLEESHEKCVQNEKKLLSEKNELNSLSNFQKEGDIKSQGMLAVSNCKLLHRDLVAKAQLKCRQNHKCTQILSNELKRMSDELSGVEQFRSIIWQRMFVLRGQHLNPHHNLP